MKILYVLQGILKGGAERLTLDIAQELRKSGTHKVLIVALDTRNQYPDMLEGLDVRFINSNVKLSISGKNSINIEEYEKIIDEFQPDIIHSHTYKSELVSREKIRKGIKYVTHVHSDFSEFEPLTFKTFLQKKRLTKFYERVRIFNRYKNCGNYFITISENINETLLRQLPKQLHKQVMLMHNALDFKKFSKHPLPKLNKEKLKLICVGRFESHKNQAFLLNVCLILKNKGITFNLEFAGIGPELENVKKLFFDYGLEDSVKFYGLINNVEEYYCDSNIYLHPSKYEPFGLVLLEAMSAGLPVISLDGKGNRDIIIEGVNGFMIKEQNDELFVEKIIYLLNNNVYESISKNARTFAKNYDIEPYVKKLMVYYQQILIQK
jgi:glycosyltransferase involved in cell wall biosynthesis